MTSCTNVFESSLISLSSAGTPSVLLDFLLDPFGPVLPFSATGAAKLMMLLLLGEVLLALLSAIDELVGVLFGNTPGHIVNFGHEHIAERAIFTLVLLLLLLLLLLRNVLAL